MNLNPSTQINLFEHHEIFNQLYKLSKNDTLPNKILLSGEKGIGKSTLAYHLINFVLSENEENPYDYENKKNLFQRLKKRKSLNRYDQFDMKFYNKVQKGFLKLAKINKKSYKIINSNLDIKKNEYLIINQLKKLIK